MPHRTFALLVAVISLGAATAQAQQDALPADAVEFFEKQVRPLLIERCYECHAGDERSGGLRLDFRQAILKGGDSGPAIQPHNTKDSLLIKAVRYNDQNLQMPPKGALSKAEIAIIERWVEMGAPDPRTEPSSTNSAQPVHGMGIDEGREFWSMRPISDPQLPNPKNIDWIKTPVDAFVLQNLEVKGLLPAPKADRATLVRRLALDLTGLPPTTEQIDAFVRNESPDAYETLIDEFLSSPQYGVRWGRHWLDVARYADSNGLDENIAYGNAWRYRDYVIDSFNKDKPIDAFITEQLAGDLLPNSNQESITGTGFLVLGAKVLAEPDREKLVMDTIDEQLDSIGKSLMGMSLGCVRCHDHKFDPIHQSDYYALAAILKSTKTFGDTNFGAIKHWNEISFASPEERESLKSINEKIAKHQAALANAKSTAFSKLRAEVRAKATDYLVAATKVSTEMTLQEVAAIAEPLGLHPRVLFHCRRHLSFHPEHPVFAKWHELFQKQDVAAIESHYRGLFQQADEVFAAAKAKDASVTKLEDPTLEAARLELNDITGFLAVPPKPEFAFDAPTLAEIHRLADEARLVESFAPDETAVMGVADDKVVTAVPLHIRGSHRNLGQPIERNFPQVMRASHESPILSRKHSGRLEFARWLTSPTHPLTARVFANRIWAWHFGTGIVASTENFGTLGDRPSNPELLDYLARRLIESGWSLKEMHRLILLSNTYQMSAIHPSSAIATNADPENRWLWKFPYRRMDAEQMRDSMLLATGQLDLRLSGKSIPLRNRQFVFDHTSIDHTKYDSLRRAVYLPVVRNNVYTWFEQFDFPDPTMPTGSRNSTTVAPQALLMMNSDLVINAAKQLATNLVSETQSRPDQVSRLYRQVVGRLPTPMELERSLSFLAEDAVESSSIQPSERLKLLCQTLLMSNEFIFVQ